jgi:hypothetical protein
LDSRSGMGVLFCLAVPDVDASEVVPCELGFVRCWHAFEPARVAEDSRSSWIDGLAATRAGEVAIVHGRTVAGCFRVDKRDARTANPAAGVDIESRAAPETGSVNHQWVQLKSRGSAKPSRAPLGEPETGPTPVWQCSCPDVNVRSESAGGPGAS